MFDKLDGIEQRYLELGARLGEQAIINDREKFVALSRERAELEPIVGEYLAHRKLREDLQGAREIINAGEDRELVDLAREELSALEKALEECTQRLKVLLIPPDPMDEKNIVLEIRAGTGGEEASLFAADLFRMYAHYAEGARWKVEVLNESLSDTGGYKEIVMLVSGRRVYSRLKYESGVHRVQRVPSTEAQGRIHTSAVTVAVLPELDEVEVAVEAKDLKIDTYRASGAGGQHVNRTDSAVRITHLPTGIVVAMQDERSQLQNRAKAMKVLRARLYEQFQGAQESRLAADRKSQVGTGDRSERIRTYNFPQNRLTDHRVGLTLYKLDRIIEGDLDELFDAVHVWFQAEAIKSAGL
jgi:peptide chain release factor 1